MQKKQIVTICVLAVFFFAAFITPWFSNGKFYWSALGVGIIFISLVYLTSKREILKLIGEYPPQKRSKFVYLFSWLLAVMLCFIFTYYLLFSHNQAEPDYKNFAIFAIVPILLSFAFGAMKIPNVAVKTQSGLIYIIRKLATSTVLLIIFIPLFFLTNILKVDINTTPDFLNYESLGRGFVGWSMVFCFYAGLFLFIFALIDFVLVVKDLSIKKPRKTKRRRSSKKQTRSN